MSRSSKKPAGDRIVFAAMLANVLKYIQIKIPKTQ